VTLTTVPAGTTLAPAGTFPRPLERLDPVDRLERNAWLDRQSLRRLRRGRGRRRL